MGKFNDFLLNENKTYLGHRVGDVLTSLQDLVDDMENLGSRHVVRLAEEIVNQIRKILHGSWEPENFKYLKHLQKAAVAIQKTIEERGDLDEILPAAVQTLEDLSGKLGVKVNNMQAPPEQMGGENVGQDDFELTDIPDQSEQEPNMENPTMSQQNMGNPGMPQQNMPLQNPPNVTPI